MPIQFYLIGNLSSGYPMALVVDANLRIELLNIDFQKLLADIKNGSLNQIYFIAT